MSDWDRTLFVIAEKLGMTVGRLKKEMSLAELLGWTRYFNSANAAEEPVDLTKATQEDMMRMFG